MAEQNSQIHNFALDRRHFNLWSIGAGLIAILVILPVVAVVWFAFTPTENIWPHLWSTTLPRYFRNTAILVISVGALAAIIGTTTAWLVTMYRFPGSRVLTWLLLLPLSIPAYIAAYALVDLLEYAGLVQTALRTSFGWQTARDYWFPEIRSIGAATIVLSGALFPYVFLLVRAALREQSASTYDVARALGAGPFMRFWRVGLPLARPAIAAGSAIVMMETISDFGAVTHFSVQTLTTGIFSTWLEGGNRSGAAQIASLILVGVFILVFLEKRGRSQSRFYHMSQRHRKLEPQKLGPWQGWLAFAICALPFAIGFLLPVLVMMSHALENQERWLDPGLFQAFANSIWVGGIAAVLTVSAGLFMVYGVRLTGRRLPGLLLPVTGIGYAAPGAVLALGILWPLSRVDHAIADLVEAMGGGNIGLLLTGSTFAIIFAYFIRFFAIAQGAADAAFGRVSPSLPMAARSLGQTAGGTLLRVYLPLIKGSLGTALLLVFVDSVKELPATLLLRPFNFNTLATRVYEKASLEQIGDAAPAAIAVISVGLVAVLLLAHMHKDIK
ncbi:MAG: iron ABC transporter permease [Paracoccaceae bacterium]